MNNILFIESELSKESLKIIEDGLMEFNLSKTSEENIPLSILLRSDNNKIIISIRD